MYKNGQAGITKASVTIVFDNTDTKLSPVGYEHCKEIAVTRQVVVGGRNKHMINGRTVRSNQVHNLFHSVQLDVNNPHFLIMQGRIVKMMNMKPLEVLGLIEEAGGTRMFERKKESSLKIIQKKERKVEEINKIIKDEISPTLEKLQKDRAAYREYTENQMHIERARRQSVAYVLYFQPQKRVQIYTTNAVIIIPHTQHLNTHTGTVTTRRNVLRRRTRRRARRFRTRSRHWSSRRRRK